jgi:ParB family chromosome partitioning protein
MAGSNRGLGKGLEALFTSSQSLEQESPDRGLQNISLDRIEPNPNQPRKDISQEGLHELAQSISEQGLLQPLLVRPHPAQNGLYQLIAGERRWRACRLAGLHSVAVLIRNISDSEALVIGLVENLQRQDLNPVEEAQAMGRLLRELNISQDELAQRLGRSRSAVANCLRLLHLQPEILNALAKAEISSGQARTLLAIPDQEARMALFQVALSRQLTVRQMEQAVSFWKSNGRLPYNIRSQPVQDKPSAGFEAARSSLQKALAHKLEAGVRIKGKQDKGSITLAYSSEEELHRLVRKLGVDLESCFT